MSAKRAVEAAKSMMSTARRAVNEAGAESAGGRPPSAFAVRDGESPWSAAELAQVRADLDAQVAQLRHDITQSQMELADLLRDSRDRGGDDEADTGAKAYEREQELALAGHARNMLDQVEYALRRLDDGSYGTCESCGQPIGKLRLQAAPRATLCMSCKTRQERG